MTDTYTTPLPEEIRIPETAFLTKKSGRPTTEQSRRLHYAENKAAGKATGNRIHYSDKEKMEAACAFAVTGNSRRTAELTKISEGTIRSWKTTEWWNDIQSRIIKEQDEELDTKLTKLIDKAVDEVNDRLGEGDYVYNPKLDKLIRKPVNAKDLAITSAVLVDKRQLLRGQPTARVEKVSQDATLLKLAEEFKKFSQAKTITQSPDIIDAELITDELH